jgi:tight adherence protein B
VIAVGSLVLATVLCVGLALQARRPRGLDRHARGAGPARAPAWLETALAHADVDIAAATVVRGWAAAGVAGGGIALVAGGVPLALLVVVGAASVPPVALHLARHRADRRIEADLPAVLDALARSLRSGASLRQAIVEVAATTGGRLGEDLARVAHELAEGVGLGDALDGWRARRPLPGVRLASTALALGADTGGASARAIDGLAQTLRTNIAVAGEVRALSSQARLSALVIACAPIGFTALATSADPRTAQFLFRTPGGLLCLVAGLGLDAVGGLWMRHLSVVRA